MRILRSGPEIIEPPPVKTKPLTDSDTLALVAPEYLEDAYVYVHCNFYNAHRNMLIRIWKTTYLIDRSSGSRSELLHAENITFAPIWTPIPDETTYSFLLVFSALPKGCTVFDLVEDIPQPGGFFKSGITRNQTDVYHITL